MDRRFETKEKRNFKKNRPVKPEGVLRDPGLAAEVAAGYLHPGIVALLEERVAGLEHFASAVAAHERTETRSRVARMGL